MPDITSRKNGEIKRLRALLDDAALRRSEGLFVCHGSVALFEALKSGVVPQRVYCLPETAGKLPKDLGITTVTQEILDMISGVEASSDVVFTCPQSRASELRGRRFIALADVRDPGNVGTVIRTADAFGIDGVIFLGNCADCFSPKAVRSTMGSVFRVPLYFYTLSELSEGCAAAGIPLIAAELSERAKVLSHGVLSHGCVMIGNEAHGLSEAARQAAQDAVMIPMRGAESLNAAVAASVLMWEMTAK